MLRPALVLAAAMLSLGAATAQTAPLPTPTATPPATPAPPAPTVTPTPTPASTPTPLASPSPTPTAAASPPPEPAASPLPRATPTPRAGATAAPATTPSPSPSPESDDPDAAVPASVPTPAAAPTALPGAVTTRIADGEDRQGGGGWLLWGGIALVVVAALIAAGVILPRRRARSSDEPPVPIPASAPPPPAARSVSPAQPAALVTGVAVPAIGYRPTRVGLNLLSMTVDGEAMLTNPTATPIEAVRVRAAMLGAVSGHEEAVAGFHRDPTGRLAAPPFALAPGEARAMRLIVASPRDRIDALTVAGRPMVVPLVAVTVDWRDAAGEHRRTQAFAVGIERVDSAKLSPVWLDQDARTFDAVAARAHGDPIG